MGKVLVPVFIIENTRRKKYPLNYGPDFFLMRSKKNSILHRMLPYKIFYFLSISTSSPYPTRL